MSTTTQQQQQQQQLTQAMVLQQLGRMLQLYWMHSHPQQDSSSSSRHMALQAAAAGKVSGLQQAA
jgi:hypothetical protein